MNEFDVFIGKFREEVSKLEKDFLEMLDCELLRDYSVRVYMTTFTQNDLSYIQYNYRLFFKEKVVLFINQYNIHDLEKSFYGLVLGMQTALKNIEQDSE